MNQKAVSHPRDALRNKAPPCAPVAPRLAGFVANLSFDAIPADVIAAAKMLLVDQIGCELIGSTLPWMKPAIELARMTRGASQESSLVNYGERLLAAEAAFVNASFGQACEMDDAGSAGGHIGTATIPVALAVGEKEGASGKAFLTAMIAGYEVMHRIMQSVFPHSALRGFHSQSIGGPFASAAVAGRLLGLDEERMTHALAIAGSHACGTTEYDQSGGEVKRIHAGLGARGGVHSALLAQFGLTGPPTIVEGKRGFCQVFSDHCDPSHIVADLGQKFHIGQSSFKLYPTVGALHTTIAACNRLVEENDLRADDIIEVNVGFDEQSVWHCCKIVQPTDVLGAQFSLAFSVALSITRRGHDLALYMDPKVWNDPELTALMPRISGYHDKAAVGRLRRCATVTMKLKNGAVLRRLEPYMPGSPDFPASKEQLEKKARRLAVSVLTSERVDALLRAIADFETISNVRDFIPLLVREPSQAH